MKKRLLLVGAGHAHLEVIRQLRNNPIENVEICLISPSDYQYYSGMFSGYAEGIYSEEQTRVNLRELTKKSKINFVRKKAVRIFPERRKLFCEGGAVYPFDLISFDIGSKSIPPDFTASIARSVKPNYQFVEQINHLRERPTPLIVGGGAAGCELALSIQTYKNNHRIEGQVKLITSRAVLSSTPGRTARKLRSVLEEAGVLLWEHEKVTHIFEDYISTNENNRIRHTGVLWLGGPVGDPIFTDSSISVDERGFAFIRPTLQFAEYDFIFGAGDCVTLRSDPSMDKSGVHAVKQGPVLFRNLRAYLTHESLQTYEPQKHALYILSAGDKKGFLLYGGFSLYGRQAWRLKHKIDTDFMNKYK
ncbi:FAD-dependent oxidoreductase [Halobacillus sp. A5]|uniref:FAD-dependent oxidoreductase n=1 Tax=Halobacillus sp. A5 TaxID=2880263 RepID=UPI0020A6D21A|nr:FAD-dependent oxidoreductase [Halobacillus sp. A5]MCP3029274.1 FAD-dependent oxidoreductase [Halobacillus sp. A5]